ncbi:MAG: imidazoleglycerol-phosphate dehydratase, partial [Campylobacter lanienae]|nr:imidazoleglycerol-phosphate dehydratase [Campylobacter lanienae]
MIKKHRKTKETDITLELEIYGSGNSDVSTGIGFFDHMLNALAKHSLMDIKLHCN